MPYDFQRGVWYAVAAGGITYVASGAIDQAVSYVPGSSNDKLRPALYAAVGAVAADALVQNFRGS